MKVSTSHGQLDHERKNRQKTGFETSSSDTKLHMMNNAFEATKIRRTSIVREGQPDLQVSSLKGKATQINPEDVRVPSSAYFLYYARLFCLFLISIAILCFGCMLYPFLTLLNPLYFRRFSDQLEAMWVNACLWIFPPTYLVQHGDFPDTSAKPKIIICNHSTEVDWYYMWMVARLCKIDRSGNVKIMLKEAVGKIPIFGWGCHLFQFIFLKRNWKEDEKIIDNALKRFCDDSEPLWIFLFPEGMTINTRSIEKSKNFARAGSRKRPELELTLLPRARGFQAVIEMIKKHSGEFPEVFDMTMSFDSYSGEIPTWEMGYTRNRDILIPNHSTLVLGKCSRRCHLDCRKFSVEDIEKHPYGVEGWLDDRWIRKDRLLQKYTLKQGFDPEECGHGKVTLVEGSLWKSLLVVAFNAAMWIYLAIAIQSKTENVSFLEMLPQYI